MTGVQQKSIINFSLAMTTNNFTDTQGRISYQNRTAKSLLSFDDKRDWRTFYLFIVISISGDRYHWDEPNQLRFLVSCLQEDAKFFISRLAPHIRANLGSLMDALGRMFGKHVLPETD